MPRLLFEWRETAVVAPATALRRLSLPLVLASIVWAGAAAAQPQENGQEKGADAATELLEPWRPEALALDPEGGAPMTLLDAVTATLRNAPNIQLQEAETALSLGLLEESSGFFDWTLTGQAAYQHENLELRQSVRQNQQDRRDDLTRIQGETCSGAERDRTKVAELTAAIEGMGAVPITSDAIFNAELRAIEALIANAAPAEVPALINRRTVLLNRELVQTIASRDANASACSESMASLARLGETPEEEDFDTASLELRLEKVFRNGVLLAPFLEGDYSATQFVGKRDGFTEPVLDANGQQIVDFGIPRERFVDFGGKNVRDLYTLRVGFDIVVPLMRGAGSDEIAAQEQAAGRQVEAARRLIRHTASEQALATSTAYWNLLAAQNRVDLFQASVDRQDDISAATRTLIEADEIIPAEISRADASLARARTNLNAARRDLVERQVALAVSIGVASPRGEAGLLASSSFPTTEEPGGEALGDAEALAAAEEALRRLALDRRADVAAARESLEASRLLVTGAQGAARDRLDLQGSVYATAVGEDSFSEATDRWEAPSYRVGLSYEKVFGNRQLRGRVTQRRAEEARARIEHDDLRRTTQLAVSQSIGELTEAMERLRFAEQAVLDFDKAHLAEKEKFGSREDVTLLDLLVSEDQQTEAELRAVDARLEVANLIAQLRFETATLLESTDGGFRVDEGAFTTLPEAE
ncbi:MAG: TolC family protein [Acidobacteriota bacterium]